MSKDSALNLGTLGSAIETAEAKAATTPAPAVQGEVPQAHTRRGTRPVASITSRLDRTPQPTTVGVEGRKFIEQLTGIVTDAEMHIERINERKFDVYAVCDKERKSAIILAFVENYISPEMYSPGVYLGPVFQYLADNQIALVDHICITAEDYNAAEDFGPFIVQSLEGTDDEAPITLGEFKGGHYRVSNNLTQVKSFIDRYDPHAVSPRVDYGVVISVRLARRPEVAMANEESEFRELLCVGAYTRLYTTQTQSFGGNGGVTKYIPVATVTSITSALNSDQLIPLALSLASEEFINRHGWLAPYRQFGVNPLGNLGNLVPDDQGAPFEITSAEALGEFLDAVIAAPHLAIDIADGRARIPGIGSIVHQPERIAADTMRFLGIDPKEAVNYPLQCPDLRPVSELIGSAVVEGETKDSRYIDFLYLIKHGIQRADITNMLYLQESIDHQHFSALSNFSPGVKPLYDNYTVFLNGALISLITQNLGQVMDRIDWGSHEGSVQNNAHVLMNSQNNQFSGFSTGMTTTRYAAPRARYFQR